MKAILELKNIDYRHVGKEQPVICMANIAVYSTDKIALSGSNGSGKSTLLHIICGLHPKYQGDIIFDGEIMKKESDFAAMRKRTGYLLQHSEDQLFCPTVLEDVAFGPVNQGHSTAKAKDIAEKVLHKMGLEKLAYENGSRLSGGEKKLAALATIIAMQPELLLLDEPGNDLDNEGRELFISTLQELDLPMIMVSHDLELMSACCNKFMLMQRGCISKQINP